MQEIKDDVSTLSNVATVEKIQSWLAPSSHTKNFEDAQEARYSKTNTWLFEHNTYQSWLSGEFNCIWLYGPSGCGKTVLASTMIDALLENGVCLYFFFDFRDERKQTLRELLLSLVCQLYSTCNGPREVLHQLYASRDWNKTRPSTESLIRIFDDMLQLSGEIYLVLDALDESKKGKDRDELLKWLRGQIRSTVSRNCKLRIAMTSRNKQQDIIDALSGFIPEEAGLSVRKNSSKVRGDIRKYIEKRIMTDCLFERWRNQDQRAKAGFQPGEEIVSEEKACSGNELKLGRSHTCEDLDFGTLTDRPEWDPILRKTRDVLVEKAGTM